MDAVIEFTDDFGDGACWKGLSDATKDYPDCLLHKLAVLYFVLYLVVR